MKVMFFTYLTISPKISGNHFYYHNNNFILYNKKLSCRIFFLQITPCIYYSLPLPFTLDHLRLHSIVKNCEPRYHKYFHPDAM